MTLNGVVAVTFVISEKSLKVIEDIPKLSATEI